MASPVLEAIKAEGAAVLQLDVTASPEVMKQKAKEAEEIYGRVDVVVNNAGFGGLGFQEELGYVFSLLKPMVLMFRVLWIMNDSKLWFV